MDDHDLAEWFRGFVADLAASASGGNPGAIHILDGEEYLRLFEARVRGDEPVLMTHAEAKERQESLYARIMGGDVVWFGSPGIAPPTSPPTR